MTITLLKSTTAVALSLTLAAPAPLIAQEGNGPFPCVAPTGEVADLPRDLAAELTSWLATADPEALAEPTVEGDARLCPAGAIRRGIERGGEDLTTAFVAAPEAVQAEILRLATADGKPAPELDAAIAQAGAAPQQTEAPAETAEAPAPTPVPQPETEAEPAPKTGEAGGKKLTDEERQAARQARAERRAAAVAAAAAALAGATAEEAPEVETQQVTEEDVRKADEDFDTSASGAAKPAAQAETQAEAQTGTQPAAQADDSGSGLSTFEKALLVGLGAAVVGTVLKNGDQVVSNSGDRVVVERDGELKVLKNDDELLRQPGATVENRTFNDGSTRSVVTYEDGSEIVTVRAADGTVLRRSQISPVDGSETVLFDDTAEVAPVDFAALPDVTQAQQQAEKAALSDQRALEAALQQALLADVDRRFSLQQVRDYKPVRALAPQVELDAVTFATGSAAIEPSQAQALSTLGLTLRDIIARDPSAVFLIEGHTDAVGSASSNLALSDRRAETVALALTQYFAVPPQNLITQGYGETDLKVPVLTNERSNRRAAVRNITALLR